MWGKTAESHSEPPRRSLLGTYKRDVAMANSLHLDEDNHNPGAQNIEIIERVRLKGHQNHFILECRSFWKTIRFNFCIFVGSSPATLVMGKKRIFQKSDMKLKDVWSYQYKTVKLACGGKLRLKGETKQNLLGWQPKRRLNSLKLGYRSTAGQRTLNSLIKVRILLPQ